MGQLIRSQNEVEAKTRLLKYANAYKLSRSEIVENERLLQRDKEEVSFWEARVKNESD